jgi:hypothetical protein
MDSCSSFLCCMGYSPELGGTSVGANAADETILVLAFWKTRSSMLYPSHLKRLDRGSAVRSRLKYLFIHRRRVTTEDLQADA